MQKKNRSSLKTKIYKQSHPDTVFGKLLPGEHLKKMRLTAAVNIRSLASPSKQLQILSSACNADLIGMTRAWGLEIAPYTLTVESVVPGPVATHLFPEANPRDSPQNQAIFRSVAPEKVGTPEDVANAVAFPASDEASYTSGQTLFI